MDRKAGQGARTRGRARRPFESGRGGQGIRPRTPAREKRLKEFVENPPSAMGARKVESVEIKDGINLDFAEDAWLHLRFSGTEPVIRCYAEAASSRELDDLLARGMEFIS